MKDNFINLQLFCYPKVEEKSSSLSKFEVNLNLTIRQILQNGPTKTTITEAPKSYEYELYQYGKIVKLYTTLLTTRNSNSAIMLF